MHNNYHFLKRLTERLQNELVGFKLYEAFSQNKNELILGFGQPNEDFYIRADLNSDFSCLNFSTEFARAKRHSKNFFPSLIDQEVIEVKQFQLERAFSIIFKNGEELLFKLFGNNTNACLIRENKIQALFKYNQKQDFDLDIQALDKSITIDESTFSFDTVQKDFPTLGKTAIQYLKNTGQQGSEWETFLLFLDRIERESFYICEVNGKTHLLLFPFGEVVNEYNDIFEALSQFYRQQIYGIALTREKKQLQSKWSDRLKKSKAYVKKNKQKLDELLEAEPYNHLADIIMANLHAIPKEAKKVELFNFYSNEQISIKLNNKLSPQKNAERFYQKAKSQHKELEALESNITKREKEIVVLEEKLTIINEEDDLKQLRKTFSKELKTKNKETEVEARFKEYTIEGFKVLVGRNSKNNDELTLKTATKNDLWLHAKDVSGSHVVIRQQPGKQFPKNVIETAAQLAAFYSKRKTDSLCPVIVTPKKYVRKMKGAPAGAVIVEKEEVVLVEPSDLRS